MSECHNIHTEFQKEQKGKKELELREIKERLKTDEYSFLRENPHLGNNVCLLTLGGSHAYGMDTKTSDLDIRGVTLNTASEILTGRYYEQFTDAKTDTVIYSLDKILGLLLNCNPNTIEMLGCKPEHYLYVSDAGRELLRSRSMFLSKRCINSFGGYANAQLRRLQNAMARDSYPKEEREKHILGTIRCMREHLKEMYGDFDDGSLKLYIDKSEREDMDTEIFVDFDLKHFPLRSYRGIMSDMNTVVSEYAKLSGRNRKKDASHLAKHMAHLLRLYMMAIDILEKGEIVTYRDKEHDLLMAVRNGAFLEIEDQRAAESDRKAAGKLMDRLAHEDYADEPEYAMAKAMAENEMEKGLSATLHIRNDFWEILADFERRFETAKENTKLPDAPDYEGVNRMKERINLQVIKGTLG